MGDPTLASAIHKQFWQGSKGMPPFPAVIAVIQIGVLISFFISFPESLSHPENRYYWGLGSELLLLFVALGNIARASNEARRAGTLFPVGGWALASREVLVGLLAGPSFALLIWAFVTASLLTSWRHFAIGNVTGEILVHLSLLLAFFVLALVVINLEARPPAFWMFPGKRRVLLVVNGWLCFYLLTLTDVFSVTMRLSVGDTRFPFKDGLFGVEEIALIVHRNDAITWGQVLVTLAPFVAVCIVLWQRAMVLLDRSREQKQPGWSVLLVPWVLLFVSLSTHVVTNAASAARVISLLFSISLASCIAIRWDANYSALERHAILSLMSIIVVSMIVVMSALVIRLSTENGTLRAAPSLVIAVACAVFRLLLYCMYFDSHGAWLERRLPGRSWKVAVIYTVLEAWPWLLLGDSPSSHMWLIGLTCSTSYHFGAALSASSPCETDLSAMNLCALLLAAFVILAIIRKHRSRKKDGAAQSGTNMPGQESRSSPNQALSHKREAALDRILAKVSPLLPALICQHGFRSSTRKWLRWAAILPASGALILVVAGQGECLANSSLLAGFEIRPEHGLGILQTQDMADGPKLWVLLSVVAFVPLFVAFMIMKEAIEADAKKGLWQLHRRSGLSLKRVIVAYAFGPGWRWSLLGALLLEYSVVCALLSGAEWRLRAAWTLGYFPIWAIVLIGGASLYVGVQCHETPHKRGD